MTHDQENERNEKWLKSIVLGLENSNSGAEYIAQRLWVANMLMVAGDKMLRDQEATIRARDGIPADANWGLTENEIVAATMMNGMLAEREGVSP